MFDTIINPSTSTRKKITVETTSDVYSFTPSETGKEATVAYDAAARVFVVTGSDGLRAWFPFDGVQRVEEELE